MRSATTPNILAPDLPELCKLLIEGSPVPMAELEGAGHIVHFANAAFCRLVGKSKDVLFGHPFAEIVPQGGKCLTVLDRVYKTGEAETHAELEQSESPIFWSYAIWPLLDAVQRPLGVMVQITETTPFHQQASSLNEALLLTSVRQHELTERLNAQLQAEITECKLAEAALKEADRRKDEFIGMLAHELRNPLAAISSASQVLGPIESQAPYAAKLRDIVTRQTQVMARLLDDLLNVSRVSRGTITLKKETVDLTTVISDAVASTQSLVESRRQQLIVSMDSEPIRLQADATRLEQIVMNLLNNATKYTDTDGRIWLTARIEGMKNEEPDLGESSSAALPVSRAADPVVAIRVRDTGIGIPRDKLPHVFELFTQVHTSTRSSHGGLGIGLYLVRSLVEAHGGSVSANSAGPGQGSEFIVRLPVGSPDPLVTEPTVQSAVSVKALGRPIRVLFVDDVVDSAECMTMLLARMGYEAHMATGGAAALEAARREKPDVVILDIGMPEMDGYEVAKRLRANPELRDVVLVALTGFAADQDRRRTQAAGFDYHLVKPIGAAQLQAMIVEATAQRMDQRS